MIAKRGQIRNRDFVATKDFSGLNIGKITPTDIDGFFEYHDKVFVFIEGKFGDAQMPRGQRLAYERLLAAIDQSGKPCILFVARYDELNDEGAADYALAVVSEYLWKGEWIIPEVQKTLHDCIIKFMAQEAKCYI